MTNLPKTCIYVCNTCRPEGFIGDDEDRPGAVFARALLREAQGRGLTEQIELKAVNCLSVCKRPCTVAVSDAGKFTYVIGDLEPERDTAAVLEFVMKYREAGDGITKWRERPEVVRKGTVARIPPVGHDAAPVTSIVTRPDSDETT
ncbi:MAG: DUF1636 domain-containing protein [Hyphomicrobiaceae bacterium]